MIKFCNKYFRLIAMENIKHPAFAVWALFNARKLYEEIWYIFLFATEKLLMRLKAYILCSSLSPMQVFFYLPYIHNHDCKANFSLCDLRENL